MHPARKNILRLLSPGSDEYSLANELGIEWKDWERFPSGPQALRIALAVSAHLGVSVEWIMHTGIPDPEIIRNIRVLILDVDGTMTDGGMFYTQSGDEMKRFHTRDGIAIMRWNRSCRTSAIMSSGINEHLIRRRAELLAIPLVYVGLGSKLEVLQSWKAEFGWGKDEILYVGDDINDLSIRNEVGLFACPSNADPRIIRVSDICLRTSGGAGAIRELVEIGWPELFA